MVYLTDEISIHDGEPIELYEFVGPLTTYLYTSWHESVTHDTKTYIPVAMKRSSIMGGAQGDVPPVQIELPFDSSLVSDNAYQIAPIGLFLTIHRLHSISGNSIIYWSGEITDIIVKGRIAVLNVPSILSTAIASQIPSVWYQGQCNHVLYDNRCAISRSTNKVDTDINAILDDGVTIQVDSVGSEPNDTFRAGEIVIPSIEERRLILRQIGTILTISFPFRAAQVGNPVELYKGCDHTAPVCRDKFSNIVNFGGHPFVPSINIFLEGLK